MAMRYLNGINGSPLVRICLLLSSAIIIANCFIGINAPVLVGLDDEIQFLDMLWRAASGQRVGMDFHNPMGFGPYYLGALFWHWFGPHYYVMRLSILAFGLSIAFCGALVAGRLLIYRADLALLFCVTLAFQLSAPALYQGSPTELTMAGFYNRQVTSALAVLFLMTFGGKSRRLLRESAVETAIAAFLLNVLFLVKISGLLLGVIILFAGCILRGRTVQQLQTLLAALIVFSVVTAIELKLIGIEPLPLIQDYMLAAHARLAYSFYDLLRAMASWPFASSVVLLVLFAVSRRSGEARLDVLRSGLIIACFVVCQYTLNITTTFVPSLWLALAAITSLAVHMDEKREKQQTGNFEFSWRNIANFRLTEICARDAIPYLLFLLVLPREIVASLFGVVLGMLAALGNISPYVVTAGNGMNLKTYSRTGPHVYEKSLNDGIKAIASLNLGYVPIANLDFSNPFPVLFLAPPPKGVHVWFDWGINVPRDAHLPWEQVIGDACVVTIPERPGSPEVTKRLKEFVQLKLIAEFEKVYKDEFWSIYRRTGDCASGS